MKIILDVDMDKVYDLSMVLVELHKEKFINSYEQFKPKEKSCSYDVIKKSKLEKSLNTK